MSIVLHPTKMPFAFSSNPPCFFFSYCLAALWGNLLPIRYVISHHTNIKLLLWPCYQFSGFFFKWRPHTLIPTQMLVVTTMIDTCLPSIWVFRILVFLEGMCMVAWSQTLINCSAKLLGLLPRIGTLWTTGWSSQTNPERRDPNTNKAIGWGPVHLPGHHVRVVRFTWVKVWMSLKLPGKRFQDSLVKWNSQVDQQPTLKVLTI